MPRWRERSRMQSVIALGVFHVSPHDIHVRSDRWHLDFRSALTRLDRVGLGDLCLADRLEDQASVLGLLVSTVHERRGLARIERQLDVVIAILFDAHVEDRSLDFHALIHHLKPSGVIDVIP